MVKKYIIMAGGEYEHWKTPRHLSVVCGEELMARTIRLLKENGITDISISTENPIFEKFGLPILKHENTYHTKWHKAEGDWCDAFYPTDEPVCYVLGDVYFSDEAIKTIVETETDDIELFGSIPPFASNYIKNHIEAFALKVQDVDHFKKSLEKTRELDKQGKFWRKPIIWELWTVITNTPLQTNKDDYTYNYYKINDYTCDIDWAEDIKKLERVVIQDKIAKGEIEMVKVQVTEEFTLAKFNELYNLERAGHGTYGKLNVGDKFECTKEMAEYLTGKNPINRAVVKVIEIIPETKPTETTKPTFKAKNKKKKK